MIEVFVFFGRIFIEYKVFDGLYGKTLPVAAEELVICHRSEEYPAVGVAEAYQTDVYFRLLFDKRGFVIDVPPVHKRR